MTQHTTPQRDGRRPKHAAGDGEVPAWWAVLDRRRLAVALGSTFVAVPVVVLDNLPQHQSARAEAEEIAVVVPDALDPTTSVAPPASTTVTVAVPALAAPAAPTTAPASTAPPTTARPAPAPTTTAPAPPPTTAPPTTAAPAPAPANTESGQATWYRYNAGECAHKTLPRGTVVTVTNTANGLTASCVVTDRGPFGAGRIIDLDDDTFAQLAPLSSGVIDVTITW